MKKVGLAKIAKAANVSPAAVSRALRGSAGLSDSSRKRILRIAQQLNYRSRAPLDSLRKAAILMPYRPRCAESNYFQQTYSGLSDGLYSAGVVLVHIPLTGSLSDGALARKLKAEHIETAGGGSLLSTPNRI
jgi:DNA-binding LacI/PurR family transcriptional regulator